MDRLLFLLAIGVWAVAGSPRLSQIWEAGPSPADWVWGLLYGAFFLALMGAMASRPPARKLAFTVLQSLLALGLLAAGMPHFEGALLAVVGAQTLLVAPPAWAMTWVIGQSIPLFATILPTHALLGSAKATGEYLAFSLFAMTAFALRESERQQRLALARMQAELLGTQTLLRDTVAMAEQGRIRRELHDSLGHHLAVASTHLDMARNQEEAADTQHLDKARTALDDLTADSRAVLGGMTPRIRLEEALRTLTGALPLMSVELDVKAFAQERPDVLWAVFRAVQEGITNAHKHAGARRVRVGSHTEASARVLTIENDSGKIASLREGVGLGSMRERVTAVGGTLEVDPGPPFRLQLRFPTQNRPTSAR